MFTFPRAIPQNLLVDQYMQLVKENGKTYRKKVNIFARISGGGEFIETFTTDGKETQRTTVEGNVVVRNPGGEIYVIEPEQLERRYEPLDNYDGEWREYKPTGIIWAMEWEEDTIYFMASWNEEMVIKYGDMLATNDGKTLYRIARTEFEQTYERP
jgi:hypothetical protein